MIEANGVIKSYGLGESKTDVYAVTKACIYGGSKRFSFRKAADG